MRKKKEVEISKEEIKLIEHIFNWTFSGTKFYYRDTDEDFDVEKTYHVGQILKSGFFVDCSDKAQKPCSRVRYIIASAHTFEAYKTDMCQESTKKCNICVLHSNSFFKVMDIYKVKDQYQIFLLHIPMHGIPYLCNASFEFDFGDGKGVDYLNESARKSFDVKLKMEPCSELESSMWKERTRYPIGIKADGSYFDISYFLPNKDEFINLEIAIRKTANDLDAINMPMQNNN